MTLGLATASEKPLEVQDAAAPVVTTLGPSLPVADLDTLASGTPVILVGLVVKVSEPYLQDDVVVRQLLVKVRESLKDRTARAAVDQSVHVRQYGGKLVVDGQRYETNFPVEPLAVGDEAILFLSPTLDGFSFEPVRGPAGVYRVTDKATGKMSVSEASARMSDFRGRRQVEQSEFVRHLKALLQTRKQVR